MQFDWTTFALEIVNFLILIWILKRFLYRPVLDTIARRRAAIEQTLAQAGTKQAEAEELANRYRERLGDWEKEKQALRTKALEEVEAERARRLEALERTLEEEREKRETLEQRERAEQRRLHEEEALRQGARFAARLLERVATPALEATLVRLAAEDLAQLPSERLQALRAAGGAAGDIKVTSAFDLNEASRAALARALNATLGREVAPQFLKNEALIAGVRMDIGSWTLHANVADELRFFSEAAAHEG